MQQSRKRRENGRVSGKGGVGQGPVSAVLSANKGRMLPEQYASIFFAIN